MTGDGSCSSTDDEPKSNGETARLKVSKPAAPVVEQETEPYQGSITWPTYCDVLACMPTISFAMALLMPTCRCRFARKPKSTSNTAVICSANSSRSTG